MVEEDQSSDDYKLSRRKVLAMTSAATTVGLAGCGGDGDSGPTPTDAGSGPTPTDTGDDPTPTEASGGTGDTATPTDDGTQQSPTGEGDSGLAEGVPSNPVTTEIAHRAPVSWQPGQSNVNPFSQTGNMQYWMEYMWWSGVTYPADGPHMGEAITWSVDSVELENNGCEVVLNFNDQYQWWDGTQMTAEDYLTLRTLTSYQTYGQPGEWPVQFELDDDYTFREIHSTPNNPAIQRSSYLTPVTTRRDYWQSWVEDFDDASSQDQIDTITSELTEYRISMQELVDEGLGNGMWIPQQWDPTEVVLEKFDGHPRASWTNLETDRWKLISENQVAIQAFGDDQLDIGEGLLAQVRQGSNPNIEIFQEFPQGGVPKLTFNFNNEHLAKQKVRQAIGHIINYEELRAIIRSTHGTNYLPYEYNIGMSNSLGRNFLGEDWMSDLIDYGQNSREERAVELMNEAGYTRVGGVWVDSNGNEIEPLDYITPPWPIYQTISRYISPTLEDFGIPNNANFPSGSSFWSNWLDTHDFDMVNWWTNASHPASAYSTGTAAAIGNYVGGVGSISGIIGNRNQPEGCEVNRNTPELTADTTERLGMPARPEFPSQVGATDINGNGQTLYPVKWSTILGQTQDDQEIQELSRKLAWWYNWYAPHIGLYEEKWTYWGDTQNYQFPNAGHSHPPGEGTDAEHYVGAYEFLLNGHVNAKSQN